jgi:peptide deformylase
MYEQRAMDIVIPPEFKPLWEQNERQPVVKYPAEVLRTVAQPVERVTKKTRELVERLEKIMKLANGVGLAAPQIGISERVIVIVPDGRKPIALINPEITFMDGTAVGEEGCLSLPGLYGEVMRKAVVDVQYLDVEGRPIRRRLEGLGARVLQHEVDHLDGVLFIDKVDLGTLHWAWPAGVAEG